MDMAILVDLPVNTNTKMVRLTLQLVTHWILLMAYLTYWNLRRFPEIRGLKTNHSTNNFKHV
jgi:hypothetical protein